MINMDQATKMTLISRLSGVENNIDKGKYTDYDLATKTSALLGKLEEILHEFIWKCANSKSNIGNMDFDDLCTNYSKVVDRYIILKSFPKSATDDLKKEYIPKPIKHVLDFFVHYLCSKIAQIIIDSDTSLPKEQYMVNIFIACTDISYPKIFAYIDTITNYLKLNTHTKK